MGLTGLMKIGITTETNHTVIDGVVEEVPDPLGGQYGNHECRSQIPQNPSPSQSVPSCFDWGPVGALQQSVGDCM